MRGGIWVRRLRSTIGAAAVGASLLCLPPTAMAAAGAFEPNDTAAQGFGPLSAGQSYQADLPPMDRDFYFFYVTTESAAPTELTLANLGGGTQEATIDLSLVDGLETPITTQPFIRPGERRTLSADLGPGKYFVEVVSDQGYGDSYALGTGLGSGTFGAYSTISASCAKAEGAVSSARHSLTRAEGRLQRAVARLRRSAYSGPVARRRAQRLKAAARARLLVARRQVRAAKPARELWCSIPE